jgi:pyruvate/2-oxoglutarate dehydrogenase complex dihydrolipoamide acyltransferase (E2) component
MRSDGTRVMHDDPMYHLIPYFLTKRYDAMNMITIDIPEAPMRAYMNAKRREGKSVSHLALVLTAYLLTVEEFPALNRFIVGKKIYQHNDITAAMVVLKPGTDVDTMSKIRLTPGDDVFDVQKKITDYIEQNRQQGEANGLDTFMNKLVKHTGLLSFATGLIRMADRLGLLPKSLIDLSPFHASLLITNLASIRTNHIYHHVYQFGTTSISIAMGNMREVPRRSRDGYVFDRCIPMGVVMDERIASGHYFAQAFSLLKKYLANPELMEREKLLAAGEPKALPSETEE